jgi:hypothetical protein
MKRRQPDQDPDIYTRIRRVLPVARNVISLGIDPFDNAHDIGAQYNAAAGCSLPDMPDESCTALIPYIDSVFVLGMAVGLSLNHTVLELPATSRAVTRRRRRASTKSSSARTRPLRSGE